MFLTAAEQTLIDRARRLTRGEIIALARGVRRGAGLRAYLGLDRERNLTAARRAATEASESAGLHIEFDVAQKAMFDSVLAACFDIATAVGHDVNEASEALTAFFGAVAVEDQDAQREIFRVAKPKMRRALGRCLNRHWISASLAAGDAMGATVTWSLANPGTAFDIAARDVLVRRWSAAVFPSGLPA